MKLYFWVTLFFHKKEKNVTNVAFQTAYQLIRTMHKCTVTFLVKFTIVNKEVDNSHKVLLQMTRLRKSNIKNKCKDIGVCTSHTFNLESNRVN